MKNHQDKPHRKRPISRRTKVLLIQIGSAFKVLRKGAGYGNSTEFAINRGIPEGSYGKYEAGIENITIDSLVSLMEAHGLFEEDVFNKDFLALGSVGEENVIAERSVEYLVHQVRNQVKSVSSEEVANSFSTDDLQDLHRILICTIAPTRRKQVIKTIGLKSKTPRFERILNFLIHVNWLTQTFPDQPQHPKQEYYVTEAGKKVLRLSEDGK